VDALARFEDRLEETLEASFTRLLKSQLQPVEIARRLARAMENERTIGLGEVLAPNRYEVQLSPADFAGLKPFQKTLEKRLAEYLAQHAEEKQLALLSAPSVCLKPDPAVPDRRPRVVAALADQPGQASLPAGFAAGFTSKVPVRKSVRAPGALRGMADRHIHPLTAAVTSVGRNLDNDIILDDPRVSRHHAQLTQEGGLFRLQDMVSANGTWVNGARVSDRMLQDGDMVSFGGVEMCFSKAAGKA
jgi:hypothetical protein